MRYVMDSSGRKRVTLIPGDGIGPEVVAAVRRIVDSTSARIAWEEHAAGAAVFKGGLESGVPQETIESIKETRVALKGPLETPVGFGEKSANVTLRKLFETWGNVRPVRELPGVQTPYSGRGVDLLVVRENVEDLYAGIEHAQSPGVAQCLKLMSRKGCERIARLGFEVARANGRKVVHCATKANIMKLTEGLLKRTFEEVAPEYPDIEARHIIVDNCAHQLVRAPEQFQVIVTSNMNGDILSDLTSGLVGGLGFAPGANLGNEVAIFEAVHGSAPKYAGRGVINPTAVLLSAVMMLRHLDEQAAADSIEAALLVTLEAGVYTRDVRESGSVGTEAFASAIIANLGKQSERWPLRAAQAVKIPQIANSIDYVKTKSRATVGVDVFVESGTGPETLGPALESVAAALPVRLKMISNRGTRVYPATGAMTDCVDHYRCRFIRKDESRSLTEPELLQVLELVGTVAPWVHVERLQQFDGVNAYSKAQGED